MYTVRCYIEGTKGLVGKILTQGWGLLQKVGSGCSLLVLPAGLHLPCSQQFGGVPTGLDETEKSSLTEQVSAAQDPADEPGGNHEGQSQTALSSCLELPSWVVRARDPTYPRATKKKISGRSKGTSTRNLVL